MLGRVAVAPEGEEAFGGLWPGPFGGNMDASDVREGTTVYLPGLPPGRALLLRRRPRAAGRRRGLRLGPRDRRWRSRSASACARRRRSPGRASRTPSTSWSRAARGRSPTRFRIAFVELIDWLVADYGFDKADAYQLVSQVAVVRVANMVDPLYTVVAKFPKRFLPPRLASAREPARSAQRRRHRHPVLGDAAEVRLELAPHAIEARQVRLRRRRAAPDHVDPGLAVQLR